jgi:DNA-binding NtrC family response regulator
MARARSDPRTTEVKESVAQRRFPCWRIRVTKGPDRGRVMLVDRARSSIGALAGNDLALSDPAVSGHHLEVLLDGSGCRLRDLGSRNGTFIGDCQVIEAYIAPKTRVVVGDSVLVFEGAEELVEVPASSAERFGPLLGRSLAMRELFAQLEKISKSESTVLITGETGTGKELVAEAIVAAGARASGPVVVVDCAALPSTLIESELFGHERGAFTGAVESRPGAFERAEGGTVFLDEIGELPLELQPKLLRVLEQREVRRLGGQAPIPVDVRLLAATHRLLDQEVNKGAFRPDLFFRLSVLTLRVPPLRERREDIPLLASTFLELLGADPKLLDAVALERLAAHSWPGNVRELRNAVERLVLGADPITATSESAPGFARAIDLEQPFVLQKQRLIDEFEEKYAEALLRWSEGNLARAARKAGLARMAVVKLLARRGLRQP